MTSSDHVVTRYTLESMAGILNGTEPLPNPAASLSSYHPEGAGPPDLTSLAPILSATTHALPSTGRLRMSSKGSVQARYFLKVTQGGSYTGEGWVLWSEFDTGRSRIMFNSFAVCVHEAKSTWKQGDTPAMRGWSPSRCAKCGLDMSVDSGD